MENCEIMCSVICFVVYSLKLSCMEKLLVHNLDIFVAASVDPCRTGRCVPQHLNPVYPVFDEFPVLSNKDFCGYISAVLFLSNASDYERQCRLWTDVFYFFDILFHLSPNSAVQ